MISILLLSLLFAPVAQGKSVRPGQPEKIELVRHYCSDPDGFTIIKGLVYLDAQRFDSQSLSEYFRPFLDSPPDGEVYLTVTADRQLVEMRQNPPSPEGPPPPKPPYPFPKRITTPLAYFYRIGENAFFQFRDKLGKTQWVVLEGRNFFRDNPWRLQMLVASHAFAARASFDGTCQDGHRDVALVVENLSQLSFESVEEILLDLDAVFSRPGQLSLSIYEDPGLAQLEKEAFFPSLDFELDGSFDKQSRIASLFRFKTGNRTIAIYEGGKPLYHRSWTP